MSVCMVPYDGLVLIWRDFSRLPRIHYEPTWNKAITEDGWINDVLTVFIQWDPNV